MQFERLLIPASHGAPVLAASASAYEDIPASIQELASTSPNRVLASGMRLASGEPIPMADRC